MSAHQAVAAGKGESRGITPYGIDYSPVDGMIWYSKLNGNRIGRIDPSKPDGDIKEWNPPFRGPRRLHVAPDGIIWVPASPPACLPSSSRHREVGRVRSTEQGQPDPLCFECRPSTAWCGYAARVTTPSTGSIQKLKS